MGDDYSVAAYNLHREACMRMGVNVPQWIYLRPQEQEPWLAFGDDIHRDFQMAMEDEQ